MSQRLVLTLGLLAVVSSVSAAPVITHTPLACVSPDANPKITAHVEGKPSSVRVYFHALGQTCGDYYVDMRRSDKDPSLYTAILPIPASDADVVLYQIRAKVAGGNEVASAPVAASVRKDCSVPALSADELQAAKSIVVGLTQPNQKSSPCKFRCDGLTNYVTASGDLKPNDECRLILAELARGATKTPWYETPAGTAAAFAGGVAAGTAIGYEIHHHRHEPAPSPARP